MNPSDREELWDIIKEVEVENKRLREALEEIANWTMHTGKMAYEEADNAYYIIEAEVSKAKKVAREAL